VNPSLTITALAEHAMSHLPAKGAADVNGAQAANGAVGAPAPSDVAA
jgi:hypothetical protein